MTDPLPVDVVVNGAPAARPWSRAGRWRSCSGRSSV